MRQARRRCPENPSSKRQIPNKLQVPNSDRQAGVPVWDLALGACLELGAWYLEFLGKAGGGRGPCQSLLVQPGAPRQRLPRLAGDRRVRLPVREPPQHLPRFGTGRVLQYLDGTQEWQRRLADLRDDRLQAPLQFERAGAGQRLFEIRLDPRTHSFELAVGPVARVEIVAVECGNQRRALLALRGVELYGPQPVAEQRHRITRSRRKH